MFWVSSEHIHRYQRAASAVARGATATIMTSLAELPPEILSQIASHLPTAKCLRDLALTSRRFHGFVEKDGWRIFALYRFPSISIPSYWKDGAHALATLSRNYDRRAFIAREVQPQNSIHCLPSATTLPAWRKKSGQTMGYQAMVDSYESWTGGDWKSRREAVVWGAGADLVLRTTNRNGITDEQCAQHLKRSSQRGQLSEHAQSHVQWIVYRDPRLREGTDDITSVNLKGLASQELSEEVVVGRASGELSLLRLRPGNKNCLLKRYSTFGSQVRSTDLDPDRNSLLAACLGDDSLALYPLRREEGLIRPASQVKCVSEHEAGCRTWGVRFISRDLIVVGRGPSRHIVQAYQVRADGLGSGPLRTFGSGKGEAKTTSAYPVIDIPTSAGQTHTGSNLLSGGYDGVVR